MRRTVSGIMLSLLLISILTLAVNIQPVKASGTVYIRANGSIDPPTAPISTLDNMTYTLTDNITSDADGIIVERENIIIDGDGYTVQGSGAFPSKGIDLTGRSNVTIKNMRITAFSHGIYLFYSSDNSISGNNITNNFVGIGQWDSPGNSISGNNITNNDYGIFLNSSPDNSISGNNITANTYYGIYLYYASDYNTIAGNNITNNGVGIYLQSVSNYNTIAGNNITANTYYGIHLYSSLGNRFYHNIFIDNTQQVYIETLGYANVWDGGYPSGGNYWSDQYHGDCADHYKGPNQDIPGSDGIVDDPYAIDADNTDRYPLMEPWTWTPPIPPLPQPQILWRTPINDVKSVDVSENGTYVAFLSGLEYRIGVIAAGNVISDHYFYGADPDVTFWLDATKDMEYIAITVEPCPPGPGGTQTGVELYRFNGTSVERMWGTVLINRYETTEVRVSENKLYVAAATSSGTEMNGLNLTTGEILWRYDAYAEQFAVDGDDDLNYVIGGTITHPYKYFILRNLGPSYELLIEGNMSGVVNDLDSTFDGLYFAFGSDAGEYILFRRTCTETFEVVLNKSLGVLIDAIEVGSDTMLVGGHGFINLYSFSGNSILNLSIPSTARVVDYDNTLGLYVVGTSADELYIINEVGQYSKVGLGASYVKDVRIENHFIAVAVGNEVIELLVARSEHDLAVTLDAPICFEPCGPTLLSATVYNIGLSNENSVELQLVINGTIVDLVSIPELLTGSSYTLSYFWTPVKGVYNVTAYAPPVLGEEVTTDNVASKIVQVYKHDVAVVNVTPSKTVVGQGYCVNITVTVENQGDINETFKVFAYYDELVIPTLIQWEIFWSMGDVNRDGYIDDIDLDLLEAAGGSTPGDPNWNPDADLNKDLVVDVWDAIPLIANYGLDIWTLFGLGLPPIGTQTVVNLFNGTFTTITFTWNTTGFAKGNYTISAYAWPLRYETDISDNNCTNGWIVVTIPGDVVEPYFEVDIFDITAICVCYDSKIGDPMYYANCDLDGNGIIDIFDVTTACITYGQKYP